MFIEDWYLLHLLSVILHKPLDNILVLSTRETARAVQEYPAWSASAESIFEKGFLQCDDVIKFFLVKYALLEVCHCPFVSLDLLRCVGVAIVRLKLLQPSLYLPLTYLLLFNLWLLFLRLIGKMWSLHSFLYFFLAFTRILTFRSANSFFFLATAFNFDAYRLCMIFDEFREMFE